MKNYSNYHSNNINDKMMHDGLLLLQNSLDGFEGYEGILNNTKNTKVLFYDKYDAQSTTKKIIGYVEDIELGNLFKINNENWLITTYPEDNKVYRKAEVQLCNSTFPIEANKNKVLIGYDNFGKPVYKEEIEYDYVPCIVQSKLYMTTLNQPINLPNDALLITLPYNEMTKKIIENYPFIYHDRNYKVIDIDFSGVVIDKGIINVTVNRVVSKT
ncbi:hypothetical protein [Heyndrickxia camelliae]|uniref:Uncharacterized protein n=1 Tax=Heyndrickxia camelliae TaxID=1707093 RepID=A0A2N3LE16_9BACI|nr:hypothetical protein [Heyndrickxia camelliae]PKR82851.1 hypothetical protein CWO92_21920 [Heyndrickxia camelliae]